MKKDNLSYEDLIINTFKTFIDIFGIDDAIILIYELNKLRGSNI